MTETIRLRKVLEARMPTPIWPSGTRRIPLATADPRTLHAILVAAYANGFGSVPSHEKWWSNVSADTEFDPALVLIAADNDDRPIGLAQCWTSGFIKDIAVAQAWRGKGVGEALLLATFHAFHERGLPHVDLKVMAENVGAIRLYQRVGMVKAPL